MRSDGCVEVGQQPESDTPYCAREHTFRDFSQNTGGVRPVCRGGATDRKSHVVLCTCINIETFHRQQVRSDRYVEVGQQPESHMPHCSRARTFRDCLQHTGEVRPVCRGGATARKSHAVYCTCMDIQGLFTEHRWARPVYRGGATARPRHAPCYYAQGLSTEHR